MPEVKIKKEKKPKVKKDPSPFNEGEVVSAYSEEGQARNKKREESNRRLQALVIALMAITLIIGVTLFIVIYFR